MQKHVLDAWMVSKIYAVIFRRRKVLEASGTRRSDEGRVVGQHFKLHQWAERFPVLGVILVAMEVYWSLTRDASKGSRFTRSFSSGWEERPSFFDCPPTEMPPSKLLNSWYLLLGKKQQAFAVHTWVTSTIQLKVTWGAFCIKCLVI